MGFLDPEPLFVQTPADPLFNWLRDRRMRPVPFVQTEVDIRRDEALAPALGWTKSDLNPGSWISPQKDGGAVRTVVDRRYLGDGLERYIRP